MRINLASASTEEIYNENSTNLQELRDYNECEYQVENGNIGMNENFRSEVDIEDVMMQENEIIDASNETSGNINDEELKEEDIMEQNVEPHISEEEEVCVILRLGENMNNTTSKSSKNVMKEVTMKKSKKN
jgi:hypothetical protein